MNNVIQRLFQAIRNTVGAILRLLPFKLKEPAKPDPIADRLKDIRHKELEDEETTRRQEGRATEGDGLAETVYRARPQNPFDKDF